jgi:Uma2 family endonuclease
MAFETSLKLTYDDYLFLPDDGRRYQIIDGELYVNAAPNLKHQAIVANLMEVLRPFVRKNRLGWVYVSPVDVVLSAEDVVQPDVTFISAARDHLLTKPNIQGAPDLMIEVLSESTRKLDQIVKRQRYAHFGVLEYWIVDPTIELVAVYRPVALVLERVLELSTETGGTLTSPLLPGLSIDIASVFET